MPSETLYPIRKVSAITGVNAVTLRAWQRRYGLIKPARSDSGHRLYSDQDIERIRDILGWLDQGVSIGKVRALLEHQADAALQPEWQDIVQDLVESARALRLGKLEASLREYSRHYPTDRFVQQILRPWLARLADSSRIDRPLIEQACRQLVIDLLMRFIKSRSGPLVAVVRCGRIEPTESVIARYELQAASCRSIDLGALEPRQLALARERLNARVYLVLLGAGLNAAWFDRNRSHWPSNVMFSGQVGRIYHDSGWLDQPYAESTTQLLQDHRATFPDLV